MTKSEWRKMGVVILLLGDIMCKQRTSQTQTALLEFSSQFVSSLRSFWNFCIFVTNPTFVWNVYYLLLCIGIKDYMSFEFRTKVGRAWSLILKVARHGRDELERGIVADLWNWWWETNRVVSTSVECYVILKRSMIWTRIRRTHNRATDE